MQKGSSKLNTILLIAILAVVGYFVFFKEETQTPVDNNPPVITPEISGNKDDLISFSIAPGQKVSGIVEATGTVKNAYFFEANILVNILHANKNLLRAGHGMATTDWMTAGPVSFAATIDFTGLPSGPAFIEIQNDDPSDGEGGPAKKIFIPVIIENSNNEVSESPQNSSVQQSKYLGWNSFTAASSSPSFTFKYPPNWEARDSDGGWYTVHFRDPNKKKILPVIFIGKNGRITCEEANALQRPLTTCFMNTAMWVSERNEESDSVFDLILKSIK